MIIISTDEDVTLESIWEYSDELWKEAEETVSEWTVMADDFKQLSSNIHNDDHHDDE